MQRWKHGCSQVITNWVHWNYTMCSHISYIHWTSTAYIAISKAWWAASCSEFFYFKFRPTSIVRTRCHIVMMDLEPLMVTTYSFPLPWNSIHNIHIDWRMWYRNPLLKMMLLDQPDFESLHPRRLRYSLMEQWPKTLGRWQVLGDIYLPQGRHCCGPQSLQL